MKILFIIFFCVITGVALGGSAGTAMMMSLSIDVSAGPYIGAVQGALLGLLFSPLFVWKRNNNNIFVVMVICFVLSFPVALISGFTMIYWVSIGLSLVSYLSVYCLLLFKNDSLDQASLLRKRNIYIIPLLCLIMASVVAFASEDKSLPNDIPSLIKMMGDNAIERSTAAGRKLKKYGKAPFLIAIEDKDPNVRGTAAHFLGLLNDRSVQNTLIKSSTDSDKYVRAWSAFSLGKIGDIDALPILRILAEDKEEIVRMRAVIAIENVQKRTNKK